MRELLMPMALRCWRIRSLALPLFMGLLLTAPLARAEEPLLVFAAASTTDILTELARRFETEQKSRTRLSFASSSTLARQIGQGAPAQVFLSANSAWMDYLETRGAIDPRSRQNLLTNRLVFISQKNSAVPEALPLDQRLIGALEGGYLSIGDPAHVPVGIYAREALEALDLWPKLRGRLAFAASVREVLAFVVRGEAALGITYASDVRAVESVRVVARVPAEAHTPIIYPIALVAGSKHRAAKPFLRYLGSPAARDVYQRHGFSMP